MEQYVIKGGNPLVGDVDKGAAKNEALGKLAEAIKADKNVTPTNLPDVKKKKNGYLTEVKQQTGIWSEQLDGSGTYNLTGTQAVAFCRVRYAGLGDVGRTGNQRMIIERCLKKV